MGQQPSSLTSLFTDLDPLASGGAAKPFVDRKDFFSAASSRASSRQLTAGTSQDSLSNMANVGFEDSTGNNGGLWEDLCCPAPANAESGYGTNPVLSLSTSSSSGPYNPHYGPPTRPLRYPENSLRVALPPEDRGGERRRSVSPGSSEPPPQQQQQQFNSRDSLQQPQPPAHSSYGSILELEASPRRYRNSDLKDLLYATMGSQDSPTAYSERYSSSRDTRASSVDSSLNIPMPLDPPPALPERPPKVNHQLQSPPPLPPKKVQQQVVYPILSRQPQQPWASSGGDSGHPMVSSNDIYDFIPEPGGKAAPTMAHRPLRAASEARSCIYEILDDHQSVAAQLGGQTPPAAYPILQEPQQPGALTVSDLVRMNVLELNRLMAEGRLPAHLSGMSLFELVDYIGKLNSAPVGGPLLPPRQSLQDCLLGSNYGKQVEQEEHILGSNRNNNNSGPLMDNSRNIVQPPQQFEPRIRPSFSDNFDTGQTQQQQQQQQQILTPAAMSKGHNNRRPSSQLPMDQSDYCCAIYPELDQLAGGHQTPRSITGSLSAQGYPYYPTSSPLSNASSSRFNMSDQMPGFEDDFAQLGQPTVLKGVAGAAAASPTHVTADAPTLPISTVSAYDKYAVFRELQFEEELVNAWKSPTEEEREEEFAENREMENTGEKNLVMEEEEHVEEPLQEQDQDGDDQEVSNWHQHAANHDFGPQTGLLHYRSGSTVDSEEEEKNGQGGSMESLPVVDAFFSGENKHENLKASCNGINIIHVSVSRLQKVDMDSRLDWAQFDESAVGVGVVGGGDPGDQNYEFSAFLSQEEQANILGVGRDGEDNNSNNSNAAGLNQHHQSNSSFFQEFDSKDIELHAGQVGKQHADAFGSSDPFHPPADQHHEGNSLPSPKNAARDFPAAFLTPPARYQSFQQLEPEGDDAESVSPEVVEEPDRQPEEEKEPFQPDWEPAFYQRDLTNGGAAEPIHREAWDLSFETEEEAALGRQKASDAAAALSEVVRLGTAVDIEEAFPMDDKYRRLGSHSRASDDSLFAANPFNDNFVPTTNGNGNNGGGGARTSSATPPLFLYDGDRLSNASDISYQSGGTGGDEGADIFAKESGFSDLTFRIEAKTKLKTSDSVNIFSVSEDPFDDDFFK